MSPVIPFALVNYAFGLVRMRFRTFVATSQAMLSPLLLYVAGGAFGHEVWRAGSRHWWEWTLLGVGAAATLGAMVVVGRVVERALQSESPSTSGAT